MKTCRRGHQYGDDRKTCLECRRINNRRWKANNPDKVKADSKKYYGDNRHSLIAKQKKYNEENPDITKLTRQKANKKWRLADPDRTRKRDRNKQLKHNYGLTPEQWDLMFVAQGRCCAICKSVNPKSKRDWCTDHCHVGGNVRGILCHPCNKGLGHFGDNVQSLQAAISYLLVVEMAS